MIIYHTIILKLQIDDINQKSTAISLVVVEEILSNCQCPYSLDYVTNSRLLCGNNDREVIYQSNLLNTDGAQATELREMVQTWVNTNPMISVRGMSQQVDSYCQVEVSEIGSTNCTAINPTTSTVVKSTDKQPNTQDHNIPAIVGGVLGGVGTIVILVLLVIILYCCTGSRSSLISKKEGSRPL